MVSVGIIFANEHLDVVLDAAGLSLVLAAGLDGDGGRGLFGHLEGEWVRVRSELLHESLLQLGSLDVLGRINLLGGKEQVLLEVQSHDLVLLATIPEAAHQLSEHLASVKVRWVQHQHAICLRQILSVVEICQLII